MKRPHIQTLIWLALACIMSAGVLLAMRSRLMAPVAAPAKPDVTNTPSGHEVRSITPHGDVIFRFCADGAFVQIIPTQTTGYIHVGRWHLLNPNDTQIVVELTHTITKTPQSSQTEPNPSTLNLSWLRLTDKTQNLSVRVSPVANDACQME